MLWYRSSNSLTIIIEFRSSMIFKRTRSNHNSSKSSILKETWWLRHKMSRLVKMQPKDQISWLQQEFKRLRMVRDCMMERKVLLVVCRKNSIKITVWTSKWAKMYLHNTKTLSKYRDQVSNHLASQLRTSNSQFLKTLGVSKRIT
jgi:hypothetical protein